MRRILVIAAFSYAALLGLSLALLEWRAEDHWLLTVLLFAPPQFFLLPLGVLAAPSLLLRQWQLCALEIGCALLIILGYMHWRSRSAPASTPSTLTLVTHNIGQGNRQQFIDFVASQNPDVLLLQDARNRGPEFERRFPNYNVVARGEFLCVSRSLIQKSYLLLAPNWHGRPVMARYEIVFHGRPLALYDIHLPTPRDQLSRFLGARRALAMFGNEELPGHRGTLHEWNAARADLYRQSAAVLAQERMPFIVAGDFNMPDHGLLYHHFAHSLVDSFAQTGSGFGFTFPGGMKSAAALLGPWLRIDYVFAGSGWTPLYCQPEPGVLSQHRAVVARLDPLSSPQAAP